MRCAHGCGIDVGSGTAVRNRLFAGTGRFIYIPLAIGLALGWLLAGYATNLCELRNVAAALLLIAVACLVGLSVSDFYYPNIMVITLLLILGIALSISLTASFIAIMNSASLDKAGAAGSLEVTGYELDDRLGITFWGCYFRQPNRKPSIYPLICRPASIPQSGQFH